MQLTATEFAKLIQDLRCDVRPDERRKNPRAPTRTRIEVVPLSASAKGLPIAQLMRVRDISRTGIGLVTNAPLEVAQRLLVVLPKTATEAFVLLCEAARVTRLPGDAYAIGVRMVRRVTDTERTLVMIGAPAGLAAMLTDAPAAATPAAAA